MTKEELSKAIDLVDEKISNLKTLSENLTDWLCWDIVDEDYKDDLINQVREVERGEF